MRERNKWVMAIAGAFIGAGLVAAAVIGNGWRAAAQKPPALADVSIDVPGKGVTRLAFVPDGSLRYLGGTCFRLNAEATACNVVLISPHPPESEAKPAPAPQQEKK